MPSLPHFFGNKVARQDFFTSIGIWLALELISFGFVPLLKLVQLNDQTQPWLYASFAAGIGGALLIGIGSQLISIGDRRKSRFIKFLMTVVGDLISLIGITGIAFPLFFMSMEVFKKLFSNL